MVDDKTRATVARKFGAAVKAARERAGLTQPALAERASVSVPAIARYESGRRAPSLAEALLLAGALGLSLDDLA